MSRRATAPERDAPDRTGTGRRVLAATGVLVVVVAMLGSGWFGWRTVGSDVVAQRTRGEEVVDTVRGGDHAETARSTTIRAAPRPAPASGTEPAVVRIPRFGPSYAVPVHPGVGDDVLARGFGHFEFSAAPGGWGNYALAAHRVTHGEPLRHVLDLRPGDRVTVSTRHWSYRYRLDTDPRRLRVTRAGVWVVDFHPVNPRRGGVNPSRSFRLLTLVTCAELFHTDDRTVVFGHLVGMRWRP